MTAELLPIIETMLDFYQKPRTPERFQTYLQLLQGNTKNDLALPIGGFNPMGKEHVSEKLIELQKIDAERIMENVCADFNKKYRNIEVRNPDFIIGTEGGNVKIKVALCLSDDLKGGWTNRFTTDFDSKFKINALVQRRFCTPVFWTSENYDADLIKKRTQAYLHRTLYWLSHPKPKTLKDHFEQEKYVAKEMGLPFTHLEDFYKKHCESDNYALIFNFFYGDSVSESLGFACFGVGEAGYLRSGNF